MNRSRRGAIAVVWGVWILGLTLAYARGDASHTFEYKPEAGVNPLAVDLAGSFNNWSTDATPMSKRADGTWEVTLTLPEGVYQYKFVVDGNKWVSDSAHSDKELEEHDEHNNSAVLIGPDARKAGKAKGDEINARFVLQDPKSDADVNVASRHLVRLRLRTLAGDVERVEVRYGGAMASGNGNKALTLPSPGVPGEGKNYGALKSATMYKLGTAMGLDTYGAVVQTNEPVLSYAFELTDGKARLEFPSGGVRVKMEPAFETPEWAKHAVWYQIFPERFRNGDPSNDPEHTQKWQSKWFSVLPGEAEGMENFYKGKGNVWWRRYGGDVQGLIAELGYLKSLGVTAIYLNPMFKAESMHKYDTADYRHIDDHFGFKGDLADVSSETDDPATWQWTRSDKLFLDFVDQAHKQGFKVILDGVFNHVVRPFWAFQYVLKNGKSSKYADWFDIRDWNEPIKYIAWDRGGTPSSDGALPVFKKDAKLGLVHGPREHVLAIAKRWLAPDGDASRGVDGFRLDVPGDIPHPFWVEFRRVVKETKPEAYISGEIWQWAQPWLKGDQFDAVMNYQFAETAQSFFVNEKRGDLPSKFVQRCNDMIFNYPLQVALVQMNLFDSHDTDRVASMFVNPDLTYDSANRIQDNGPKYNPDKPNEQQWTRMKQEVAYQMTFLGAPMIYYGDEAGMWGPDDPSNRQPMIWKDLQPYDDPEVTFKQDLFDRYQRLIAIRNTFPALQIGSFRAVYTDDKDGVVAYARELEGQPVYVVLNRSPQSQKVSIDLDKPGVYVNYLNADDTVIGLADDAKGRATVRPKDGVMRGPVRKLDLNLGPYESAVLAK